MTDKKPITSRQMVRDLRNAAAFVLTQTPLSLRVSELLKEAADQIEYEIKEFPEEHIKARKNG